MGGHGLKIGSLVAPIWGGPVLGSGDDRKTFIEMVRKSFHIGQKLTELGIRPSGVVRIDSASSPHQWDADPAGNTKLIAQTFREAWMLPPNTARNWQPKAKSAGVVCTAGKPCWKRWKPLTGQTWAFRQISRILCCIPWAITANRTVFSTRLRLERPENAGAGPCYHHECPAPLDYRLPRSSKRRYGIWLRLAR